MLFNSFSFFIFFPVVTGLYFVLPHRLRWALLLLASIVFYMAFIPAYILVLFVTIVVDYAAGILIERSAGKKRAVFLAASIAANVGFLAFFKYYGFAVENLNALSLFLHWNYTIPVLRIAIPIGLSFHTFQAMSYTIEVFRGRQSAERHLGIYALYVLFYPQLVAGPIERPQNLIHQFYEQHAFEYVRVTNGLKRMAWGMFKKVVIADRAAVLVDVVYNAPAEYHGLSYVVATVCFAFQIYCDFSGYSDIAIGAAEVMGFRLMQNFNHPYASASIPEFWRRWHISLSTWLKDYVYIPMGGSRVGYWRRCANIMIVFLLSGLWHGASWNFIIWGGLHGAYQAMSISTAHVRSYVVKKIRLQAIPRIHRTMQICMTFGLTTLAWVFFRARETAQAWHALAEMFRGVQGLFSLSFYHGASVRHTLFLDRPKTVAMTVAAIFLMETAHVMERRGSLLGRIARQSAIVRWAVYALFLWMIILFGKFGEKQFIYFVF